MVGRIQYAGYFSTPANAAPPQSQSAPQPPATTNPTYYFIVDSPPGMYAIILDVGYQADGSGTSILTFNSVAPTGSLKVQQVGTQTFDRGAVFLNPPIQISATSSVRVDQNTSGQFMFMQIVTSTYRQRTDSTGQSWYQANTAAFPGFNGPLIDNGPNNVGAPYELPKGYVPTQPGAPYSWSLPDSAGNTAMPTPIGAPGPWMQDYPDYIPTNAGNLQVSAKDSFSTYLMYQPFVQGVWIALSQINWSWSETSTNNGGTWTGTTTPQPTPADATTPEGAAAFPTWVNLTTGLDGFIKGS